MSHGAKASGRVAEDSRGGPRMSITVNVTAPGAGATLTVGQPFTITWFTAGNDVAGHLIRLSLDGGTTFNNLSGATLLPAGTTSFRFTPQAAAPAAGVRGVAPNHPRREHPT